MGKWHLVQQGEHLMRIAAENGFASIEPLWNHPENADLRALRSPEVLLPGDRVFVPDPERKSVSCATGRQHRFVVRRMRLTLRVRVLDEMGTPLPDVPVQVDVDGQTTPVTTDSDAKLALPLAAAARRGRLTFGDRTVPFDVGFLDPIDTPSGWQGRLMNLGYYDGPVEDPDAAELRAALEEFQCDQSLALTGEFDAATQAKLLEVHGC